MNLVCVGIFIGLSYAMMKAHDCLPRNKEWDLERLASLVFATFFALIAGGFLVVEIIK